MNYDERIASLLAQSQSEYLALALEYAIFLASQEKKEAAK